MTEPCRSDALALCARSLWSELEACDATSRALRAELRLRRAWSWWRFAVGLAIPLLLMTAVVALGGRW
jgi:hypothetical protein